MPDYIRRGGLDVAPPPWICADVGITVFYVHADASRLQEICERTLNVPSGLDPKNASLTRLKYRPVVSWVALTFQSFTGMHSGAPADPAGSVREFHTYAESAFWVMVEDSSGRQLLIPYMFIDDGTCMAAGREIYGFPKEFGTIATPTAADPTQPRFSVEALAVAAGSAEAHKSLILECVHVSTGHLPYAVPSLDPDQILESEAINRMQAVFRLFLNGSLDFVFLREIRALGGMAGSDLQQVTSACASVKPDLRSLRILRDYELRIPPLDSHPIARDLGLPSGPISVPFGFQCRCAFSLGTGRLV